MNLQKRVMHVITTVFADTNGGWRTGGEEIDLCYREPIVSSAVCFAAPDT